MTRKTSRPPPFSIALALVLAAPTVLIAQEADRPPPEGWIVRTDGGGHGGGQLEFTEMPPGWHITTGPACILYHPENSASGEYRIEMEVFLFDPGRRREGFGLFIGGSDLEGDGHAYTYFLIRRDGSYLIKRRDGAGTSTLEGWTEHDGVLAWQEKAEDDATAKNVLAVEVGAETVAFFVNGERVASLPKAGLRTDGIFGLRVNHGLNVHVARLELAGE